MFPMGGVPDPLRHGLAAYRDVFCRAEGFDHISRYVSGLILSPNQTLQGLYALQVWEPTSPRSRRAMHEAVVEAGWAAERLMPRHREVLAPWHRGRGREVISLDWTYAHHERGLHIWGGEERLGPGGQAAGAVSDGDDGSDCQSGPSRRH